MHKETCRHMVLKELQTELKKTKEHSKEWHRLTKIINEMVAQNYLEYVTK